MKFWATIGAFFTAILGALGLFLKGGQSARRKRKIKDLENEQNTRDRMDDAHVGDDPAAAKRLLTERQRRRGL